MIPPTIIPINDQVGNDEKEGVARAASLISLLYRTVAPETWFVQGGKGCIRAFFNAMTKGWYLSVYSDDATVVTAVANAVKALAAAP